MIAADELKALRTALGLSKEAMARLLGVGVSSLHRWEKAQRSGDGPAGTVLQVYRALDKALRRGNAPKQILSSANGDASALYARIFAMAYPEECDRELRTKRAVLPYYGSSGITRDCLLAVASLLRESTIEHIRVVSEPAKQGPRGHGLFVTCQPEGWVVILPGFTSGYAGEGPSGLSLAIALLHYHEVEMDELVVDADQYDRLESCSLTRNDVSQLVDSRPTPGTRVFDYVLEQHRNKSEASTIWQSFDSPLPFSILDPRLMDLAKSFRKDPDSMLVTAYRRLEDLVRRRTGLKEESGARLMSSAFLGTDARLGWEDVTPGESTGRAQRFVSGYTTYRNPRAHREPRGSFRESLRELMVINELFCLEANAIDMNGTAHGEEPITESHGKQNDRRQPRKSKSPATRSR